MADVLRSCAKMGCRWPAAASLSYRYATRQVWLLDLVANPDPSLYDLCPHHADHLVVPQGWDRVDDRSDMEVMVEPSASDRAAEAARRHGAADDQPARTASSRASPGRNRYAELVEALPRLAAENSRRPSTQHAPAAPTMLTVSRPAPAGPRPVSRSRPAPAPQRPGPQPASRTTRPPQAADDETPDTAGHSTAQEPPLPPAQPSPAPRGDVQRPAPMPSRDLAPLPSEPVWPEAEADAAAGAGAGADDAEPLPGQLAIPVDDLDDGVVVPFELAGGRRRPTRD